MADSPAIHNDLPTLQDRLQWAAELAAMSRRIQQCQPPHVFGVHGDWGSGKTSFMRQLQRELGGLLPKGDGSLNHGDSPAGASRAITQAAPKVVTVWFDAWRYQNEAVPVVALVHEMHRQLPRQTVVKNQLKKLGSVVTRSILDNFVAVAQAVGQEGMLNIDKVEAHGLNWEKDHFEETLPTNAICEHLHQTVQALLPKHKGGQGSDYRVVVFIDDIDRCNPKAAMRLLEGLKIYLQIPDCVFVLGMNERVLVKVIQDEVFVAKSSDDAPEKDKRLALYAAHYLEKMCTDIYRLPMLRDPLEVFCGWIDNSDGLLLPGAVPSEPFLPPNPRRLKALANQFLRLSQRFAKPVLADAEQADAKEQAQAQQQWAAGLLIVAYVYQFHRDIWERWYFDATLWEKLVQWCQGKTGQAPPVVRHLTLPTQSGNLADLDPGDIAIFWIANLIKMAGADIKANSIHRYVTGSGTGV